MLQCWDAPGNGQHECDGDETAVLADRRRRELIVDVLQPARQQLTERGGCRHVLAGGNLADQRGERPLGLTLGPVHGPTQLTGPSLSGLAPELDDQLPDARTTLTQRATHRTRPCCENLAGSWMAACGLDSSS